MKTEVRYTFTLMFGTGIAAVISMLYSVYVGRMLGPAESADFFAVISFCLILRSGIGPINTTLARFTSDYAAHDEYGKIVNLYREIKKRVLKFFLFALFVGLLCIKPIAVVLKFKEPLLLLLAYLFIYFSLFVGMYRGLLRGMHLFGKYNVNSILEATLRILVGGVLLAFYAHAILAFLPYVCALAVVVLFSQKQLAPVLTKHEPVPVDGSAVRRFSGFIFINSLFAASYINVDMLFVKHYLTSAAAGEYGAALTLVRSIGIVFMAFNISAIPLLTSRFAKKENVFRSFLYMLMFFIMIVSIPIGLFYFFATTLIRILYGESFQAAAPILFPLALVHTTIYSAFLVSSVFAAAERFRYLFILGGGIVGLVVGLSLFHASWQEIVGVALAVNAAVLLCMGGFLCYEVMQDRTYTYGGN